MTSLLILFLRFAATQVHVVPPAEPDVQIIDFGTKQAAGEVENEFPVIAMKGPL